MRSPRTFLSFLTVAALALCLLGADWPRFRGPDSAAVSQEKGLPVHQFQSLRDPEAARAVVDGVPSRVLPFVVDAHGAPFFEMLMSSSP